MNPDLAPLLALQADDEVLHELESRIEAFRPRIEELDRALNAVAAAADRARAELQAVEKHERELQTRMEEQKHLHERSMGQLDAVRKPKEAAAAMTQADITRRVLQDVERELHHVVERVVEARRQLSERDAELEAFRDTQKEQRSAFESEIEGIRQELQQAREKRAEAAEAVSRSLLQKYDRIRGRRRVRAVYAVVGGACGSCDTALPIQRRNIMQSSGSIESCEACGVLLYVEA